MQLALPAGHWARAWPAAATSIARVTTRVRFRMLASAGPGRRGPGPLTIVLLSVVDHGEPADLGAAVRRLDVEEVHAAGHELVVPVPEVPHLLASARGVVMRQDVHQDPAGTVDPDDRLARQ